MKATIEVSKETLDKLSFGLGLSQLYSENGEIDEDELSYAIKLMVDLCVD